MKELSLNDAMEISGGGAALGDAVFNAGAIAIGAFAGAYLGQMMNGSAGNIHLCACQWPKN
jgi:hypothetical protein